MVRMAAMRKWVLLTVVLGVAGCGRDDDAAFREKLKAGAPCSDLFEARNAVDPHSPQIRSMNESLRSVGCFTQTSERKD